MKAVFALILNWSEVWAPLIPLAIFFIRRPKSSWTKPIVWYLIIAFIFCTIADIIWQRYHLGLEGWFQHNLGWMYENDHKTFKNNIYYNFLSIARFLLFTWFFSHIAEKFRKLNRLLPALFILLVAVNFIFFENIQDFSSRQFSVEAALLLFYCLYYFHLMNMDDKVISFVTIPHFWVVTGLTIYTTVNFLIFLFYKYLMTEYTAYSVHIWNVHNITYIILNFFIAFALYKSK